MLVNTHTQCGTTPNTHFWSAPTPSVGQQHPTPRVVLHPHPVWDNIPTPSVGQHPRPVLVNNTQSLSIGCWSTTHQHPVFVNRGVDQHPNIQCLSTGVLVNNIQCLSTGMLDNPNTHTQCGTTSQHPVFVNMGFGQQAIRGCLAGQYLTSVC